MLQSTDYASQDKQMETFKTSLMFHEKFFLIKCSTESPICIVWECLGEQGGQTSRAQRNSALNFHWCWSWTWCKQLTHCKSWLFPDAGKDCRQEEKGMRGWDGWMASPTQWMWVWASSRSCDGQGSLECFSPWCCKESDTTEQLNWTELWEDREQKLQPGAATATLQLTCHVNRKNNV